MTFRRFAGNLLIFFGVLNFIDFMSPRPIPTVGVSAIIGGIFFVLVGLYFRSNPQGGSKLPWSSLGRLLESQKKTSQDREAGGTGRGEAKGTPGDPLLSVRVLRLASEKKGRLTLAQTAIALNVSLDQVEGALDECSKKGSAYMEVNPQTGFTTYCFPEFLEAQRKDD